MKTSVYVCDSMIMTPVVLDFTCDEGFPHYIAVVIIWETKSQCLQLYGYTSKFAFYFVSSQSSCTRIRVYGAAAEQMPVGLFITYTLHIYIFESHALILHCAYMYKTL